MPSCSKHVGLRLVVPGQRAHAVIRQELGLVEHARAAGASCGGRAAATAGGVRPRPAPASATPSWARSGRCLRNQASRLAKLRQSLSSDRVLDHLDGEQRDQPDHRTHPQRYAVPARQVQDVVEELVLLVPQPDARRRRYWSWPRRCRGSARRTWWRYPRRHGCAAASSRAMRIRLSAYIAIQAVPSDWSR